MDINPWGCDHKCYVVSKAMTRLLRHDPTIHRETDGAVKFDDSTEEFKKKKRFDGALQWSSEDWISILARRGGAPKKVSALFEPELFQIHLAFQSNPRTFRWYCH